MAATAEKKLSSDELAAALRREPLICLTKASEVLGILRVNFKRDAKPYLTEVPVEGSASVYFRSEVRQLAREFKRRRARSNGK